jgi:integrase
MNRTLTLVRYAKTDKGWRRGAVILSKNGKIKPDHMLIGGQEVYCPDGRFQLRRYEGTNPVYTDLSNDASDALTLFRAEELKHEARLKADEAGVQVVADPTRKTLRQYADAFIKMHEALPHRSTDAVDKYTDLTDTFCKRCPVTHPEQVTQEHVIAWCGWLQKPEPNGRGFGDRTRANYYTSLRGFLKYCGLVPDKIITKGTHKLLLSYTKKAVTLYEPHVVELLIKYSESDRMKLCWEFAYKVGCRDTELQHVTRTDFHGLGTKSPTVHIKERDELGNIKDKEERVIELEPGLAKRVKVYLAKYPKKVLLFGTENDLPDGHLLRTLKRTANRAGLACGHCAGCKRKVEPECREYTLHRFRRTYTSRMLVATGGDLAGVMKRTGHTDLDSVRRYLAPVANFREALQSAF